MRASFEEERGRSPFAYGGLVLEGNAGKAQLSAAYMYWRHSLNSLTDIIDKDDKASLAELHQLMNASGSDESGQDDDDNDDDDNDMPRHSGASVTSSLERRRSLPARTSMVSLASTILLPPLPADPDGFQQRRRRAAKLTHFFGVNYRDLFGDVLAHIEKGMREELSEGHIRQAEMEELMGRLRKLKVRRESIVVA